MKKFICAADKVDFVKYDKTFLALSWEWLNDKEIKQLTLTPDMTREGQRKWFDGLSSRDDYFVWGLVYDGLPVGVVGLKHIDMKTHEGEYFGYIGNKAYWGGGAWSIYD